MKKKFFYFIVCIVLLSLVLSFSACSYKKQTSYNLSEMEDWSFEQEAIEAARDKGGLTIIDNNTCNFEIVYPDVSSLDVEEAAIFFASILSEMSGCEINAVKEAEHTNSLGAFYVGEVNASSSLDLSTIQNDGYRLYSDGQNIYIKGKDDNATLNGVYDFIESELDCMYVRSDYTYVPRYENLKLRAYDDTINPSISWRRVYQYEALENDWYKKLRMNGAGEREEGNNIEYYKGWGSWCHTSFKYISPDEYFETHPEYFSLINGKRCYVTKKYGNEIAAHLCYTNEDVYQIVKSKLIQNIKDNPDVIYWDISIMDTYAPMCECDNCKQINKAAKSGMGTLLTFLNRLGRDIKDDYPGVFVSTLAYQECQEAPVGIECEDNVAIKVCAFPGSQKFSFADENGTKESKRIQNQIEDWSNICDHIIIWDYVVNFSNLLMPFPNMEIQKENIEFYIENNVVGIFHQGSRESGDENAYMRTYLLSRQLWDKDVDLMKLTKKYIKVSYGEASEYIEQYFDLQYAEIAKSNKDLSIYDMASIHKNGYLSKENVDAYVDLTKKALDCATEESLYELESIRISALYAKLEADDWDYDGKMAVYDEFKTLVIKHNIEKESEWGDMDAYLEYCLSNIKGIKTKKVLAIVCPIVGVITIVGLVWGIIAIVKKHRKTKQGS